MLKRGFLKVRGVRRKAGGLKQGKFRSKRGRRRVLTPQKDTPKLWSLKRSDREFRKEMLKTQVVKCVFPNCEITDPAKLTVSHYHGRVNKATRFDKKNCDFLCRNHHYWDKQLGWEFQKQIEEVHGWNGRYTLFMYEKLGQKGFDALLFKAKSGMKQKEAILNFQYGTTEA